MAKNAKTAAVKGRETKLNKKSSEELIQIILRKDALERNLNTQITNLKEECNVLINRIQNIHKDMDGTVKSWQKKYEGEVARAKDYVKSAENYQEMYEEEAKASLVKDTKIKALEGLAYVLGAIAVICALGWIL